jgi:lysophospholipid acyltransferase (LPLAT)-like uncharacterized protein
VRDWRLSLYLGPLVSVILLRLGAKTLRRVDAGREHLDAVHGCGENVIFAFWHGRLLMMPFATPGTPATILISQHRDGEYIWRIARRLGFAVERGSATRGGARAFRRLVHLLRDGHNAVVTPDGPKGPRGRVKSGVIELSRLSGRRILPAAVGAWPRAVLGSWDRFLIPVPLGRLAFVWGAPLSVPPHLSKADGARFQQVLAAELDRVTAEADRLAREGRKT